MNNNMRLNLNRKWMLAILVVTGLMNYSAMALPANTFASSSLLSSGRWVRIAVDRDGVYQLTQEELSQMGFSDINQVKVYGFGGHMISEELNGLSLDDLIEQPTIIAGGKLCFYGKGPLKMTFTNATTPHFSRLQNAYSSHGHYFLTEGANPLRVTQRTWLPSSDGANHTTSYNWMLHEEESATISQCGKDLLGENLLAAPVTFNYHLPNLSSNILAVQTRLAGASKDKDSLAVSAKIVSGGTTIPLRFYKKIAPNTATMVIYNTVDPLQNVTLPAVNPDGAITVNQLTGKSIDAAHLDYVLFSYEHTNTIDGEPDNQSLLVLSQASIGDTVTMANASDDVLLWNVDSDVPVQMAKKVEDGITMFNVSRTAEGSAHVAFDPQKELCHITSYEAIPNQNLHGAATPDMLIVTRSDYMEQAERLADLHRQYDNVDVLVVDEQQAFNEFSSGTRDAMAIRLLCKMFYDRNPHKFKYLLLMGQGIYDNRQLSTTKPGCIITYEADISHHEMNGNASDDFFGFLDDGSGIDISQDMLRLAVGRITSANVHEAKSDVDKIISYVSSPDYGSWRNNAFVAADQGDNDMHIYQAEGICEIIREESNVLMRLNRDYIPMFPKATNEEYVDESHRSCPESTRFMTDALTQGQYFATYVGHAAQTCFTGDSKLWTNYNAVNTSYPHWPIMTTACCNVGRFDSNKRGIAENMLHKADGGCIALIATSRETLASNNDKFNQMFSRFFFKREADGSMPTLGEVYISAKNKGGSNQNKLNFMLLGDPLIQINYPLPLIDVTRVNNVNVSNNSTMVTAGPMQTVTIEAQVLKRDKSGIDTSFNGDATVSLYDGARLLCYAKQSQGVSATRRIDYTRTLISQFDARVTNGKLTASIIIPRHIEVCDTTLLISLYAHKDNSDQMVNGTFERLMATTYDESQAIIDNLAPVIDAMYLGDDAEEFAHNPNVGQHSILHFTASDETGISGLTNEVGNCLKLELDNGFTSYATAKSYAIISNNGKQLDVDFPISNLSIGKHQLALTVFDIAGNFTKKTIDFTVSQTSTVVVEAEAPHVSQQARFNLVENSLSSTPEVTIKVTDAVGNIVWQQTTATFPCAWDLKGPDGQRVSNGLYHYWCTYDTDEYYGGSPIGDLIVAEN